MTIVPTSLSAEQLAEDVQSAETTSEPEATPALAIVFQVLGVREILGGSVLGFSMLRGEPGYGLNTTAYIAAIAWIVAGLVSGLLFFAIAEALKYLQIDQ